MEIIICSFLESLNIGSILNVLANTTYSPKLDLSIEGMRSQQFSTGVFFFYVVGSIGVFRHCIHGDIWEPCAKKNEIW